MRTRDEGKITRRGEDVGIEGGRWKMRIRDEGKMTRKGRKRVKGR